MGVSENLGVTSTPAPFPVLEGFWAPGEGISEEFWECKNRVRELIYEVYPPGTMENMAYLMGTTLETAEVYAEEAIKIRIAQAKEELDAGGVSW